MIRVPRARSAASALLALALSLAPTLGRAAATPAPAPSAAPAAPAALLHAALDAPNHVSYVGEIETTRWGATSATSTIQRVEHLAPSETRRTFLAPPSLYGEYDVTIGSTTLRFETRQDRVEVNQRPGTAGSAVPSTYSILLAQNYRAVLGPVDVVAARPAATVWLVNRYTGERSMRLWIDNATKIVLAKEAYHSDGSLAWRQRFDDIRFTAQIPADIFSTTIPNGFQEVEGSRPPDMSTDLQRLLENAGFHSVGPHYLPEGFGIVGADVSVVDGVRSLHFFYSDGIRSLSLFENGADAPADFGTLKPTTTRFDGHVGEYVKNGPTMLLAWRDGGLAFTLVGDLDLKELVKIASSVEP